MDTSADGQSPNAVPVERPHATSFQHFDVANEEEHNWKAEAYGEKGFYSFKEFHMKSMMEAALLSFF